MVEFFSQNSTFLIFFFISFILLIVSINSAWLSDIIELLMYLKECEKNRQLEIGKLDRSNPPGKRKGKNHETK